MPRRPGTSADGVMYPLTCGSYTPGHDMHFIQARLCWEEGPGTPNHVERVDDDGTIHLVDGSTFWNHDPERLRAMLHRYGNDVFITSRHVMRVPNDQGSYMICLADEPDPCRSDTDRVIPGESLAEEIKRRGGALRPVVRE